RATSSPSFRARTGFPSARAANARSSGSPRVTTCGPDGASAAGAGIAAAPGIALAPRPSGPLAAAAANRAAGTPELDGPGPGGGERVGEAYPQATATDRIRRAGQASADRLQAGPTGQPRRARPPIRRPVLHRASGHAPEGITIAPPGVLVDCGLSVWQPRRAI